MPSLILSESSWPVRFPRALKKSLPQTFRQTIMALAKSATTALLVFRNHDVDGFPLTFGSKPPRLVRRFGVAAGSKLGMQEGGDGY